MSDLIEIKLSAEVADDSMSKIKEQFAELEKSVKIKPDMDTTAMSKKMKELEGKIKGVESNAKKPMKMDIDTEGVKKSIRDVEASYGKVGTTINKVTTETTKLDGVSQGLTKRITDVTTESGKMLKITENINTETGKTSKQVDRVTTDYKKQVAEVEKLNKEQSKSLWGQSTDILESRVKTSDALKDMGKYYKELERDSAKAAKQVQTSNDKITKSLWGRSKDMLDDRVKTPDALKDMKKHYTDMQKEANRQHAEALAMNKKFDNELKAQMPRGVSVDKFGGDMQKVGRNMIALAAPVLAVGGAAIKASVDFESSFAGIKKTVNASEEEFAVLEKSVREMAKSFPQSASEIAKVGEIAGQLGIAKEEIMDFTKVMTMLGDTTNMTSESAATDIARFANITNMSADNYERLGSVIVDLGKVYCPATWKQVA